MQSDTNGNYVEVPKEGKGGIDPDLVRTCICGKCLLTMPGEYDLDFFEDLLDSMHTQWEYTFIQTPAKDYLDRLKELNSFGEEGWEVIGSEAINQHIQAYLLKRPKKIE